MRKGSSTGVVRGGGRAAGLAAVAIVAWAAVGASPAQQYRPAPLFEGKSIPEPPEQGKPWAPPQTLLPKFLTTATAALFEQGVADPRGCEYREVEVAANFLAKTHAFVLPERPDIPGRFVVCWDGQVYPAPSVGGPADLDHDMRELAEAMTKDEPSTRNKSRFYGGTSSILNAESQDLAGPAGVQGRGALKLCLLLRLGRADLAEALFAAGTSWTPEPRARDLTDYGITYQTLAGDWASAAFPRLISAHQRGDDAIALHTARKLAKFRDLATARMDEMGFPRGTQQGGYFSSNAGANAGPPPRFPFMQQLDVLLADHERRAAMPPRGPIPPKGGDPAARVAALIRDFDQIAESQMMSPGSADPGSSPLVTALAEEGDAAVEPLLKALESDDRLTRSISHGRSISAVDAYVHPVVEAVTAALIRILKTREFGDRSGYAWITPSRADRKALAGAMRQYWERNRAIPLAERWYKMLLDDAAGPARWLEAAGGIVGSTGPENVYVKPGTAPMRGEVLRDGRTPTVTDLMLRRAREIARGGGAPGSPRERGLNGACTLASSLTIWDERASLPLLQELGRECRATWDRLRSHGNPSNFDQSVATNLTRFTTTRARLGDLAALDEYADWLRTTSPKMLEYNTDAAFKPLVNDPAHPSLVEAAKWLFTDPKSPWVPLLPEARGDSSHNFRDLTSSALLVVPAFRDGVIAGLADKTPIGTVSISAEGHLVRKMKNGSTSSSWPPPTEGDAPAPGVEQDIRCCDLLASNISKVDGSPRFELTWSEARRDQAIAACVEFLKRYGPLFETEAHPSPFESGVLVKFPALGRPATPQDVAAGMAIFALEGEVRTVKLPGFPQETRWLTLKDAPQVVRRGNGPLETQYQTDGRVWQAEEVREGDRWVRYYGFVGHHTIGKAPASEIEFGSRYGWNIPKSRGLDARLGLDLPTSYGPGQQGAPRVEPGRPIPLILRIFNRSGLDNLSPTEFLRPAPDGKPALRKGIVLKLARSIPTGSPLNNQRMQQAISQASEPAKRQADFEPTGETRLLAPAETFEALRIDLNDWFDLPAPGLYAVSVTFPLDMGLGEGPFTTYAFQVGGE